MQQLSMIEVIKLAPDVDDIDRKLNSRLSDAGKSLFVADMQEARCRKRPGAIGCTYWWVRQLEARKEIARLQNALYELNPDRYPQFGALG